MAVSLKTIETFLNRIKRGYSCWNYMGPIDKQGRGYLGKWKAPRLAYYIFNKVDPGDNCVCHSCDNPRCVRPTHLWLGTRSDNTKDMWSKNRQNMKRVKGAKLTQEQVQQIKQEYKKGIRGRGSYILGKKYGINPSTIVLIAQGKIWKHI